MGKEERTLWPSSWDLESDFQWELKPEITDIRMEKQPLFKTANRFQCHMQGDLKDQSGPDT